MSIHSAIVVCRRLSCHRSVVQAWYVKGTQLRQRLCVLTPLLQFCPDEESACRPLIPLGQACPLNRDGEHPVHSTLPAC
jgi:hypothetical protein